MDVESEVKAEEEEEEAESEVKVVTIRRAVNSTIFKLVSACQYKYCFMR